MLVKTILKVFQKEYDRIGQDHLASNWCAWEEVEIWKVEEDGLDFLHPANIDKLSLS